MRVEEEPLEVVVVVLLALAAVAVVVVSVGMLDRIFLWWPAKVTPTASRSLRDTAKNKPTVSHSTGQTE